MWKEENRNYVKLGITLLCVIAASLALFFILFKAAAIRAAIGSIIKSLRPCLYGAVIAYILTPLCRKLEKLFAKLFRGKLETLSSALAIILSLLIAVLVVWLLLSLVLPQIWKSLNSFVIALPENEAAVEAKINEFMENRPELFSSLNSYYEQFSDQLDNWVQTRLIPSVQQMAIGLGSHVYDLLGAVKDLIIGLLVSAYVLASRKRFAVQGRLILYSIFPVHWAQTIEKELHYADRMFNGFLVGKLFDSAIIGVICLIGTTLMGFDSAVLVSAIVAITNIIPFFGPIIGAVPCVVFLLLENPLHAVYFIIFIIILQQLDGNFIGPLILGDSTGLSSIWVLFSILLFGGMWGIPGMIVGVPMFAVIYDVIRQVVYRSLRKKGVGDMIQEYDDEFVTSEERVGMRQRIAEFIAKQKEKKAAKKQ